MKRIIVESPYAGNVAANLEYLKECILDSLDKGEAPFASHGFFTQYLDDLKPDERELGIKAGFVWGSARSCASYILISGRLTGCISDFYTLKRLDSRQKNEASKRRAEHVTCQFWQVKGPLASKIGHCTESFGSAPVVSITEKNEIPLS